MGGASRLRWLRRAIEFGLLICAGVALMSLLGALFVILMRLESPKSGTGSDYTVSEFWADTTVRASETHWVGLYRIGERLIHVPMTIVLLALFVFVSG